MKGSASAFRVRAMPAYRPGPDAEPPLFYGRVVALPGGGCELTGVIRAPRSGAAASAGFTVLAAPFFFYGFVDMILSGLYLHWVGVLQGLGFAVMAPLFPYFIITRSVRGIRAGWGSAEYLKEWLSQNFGSQSLVRPAGPKV
jgi:hypothetical protein